MLTTTVTIGNRSKNNVTTRVRRSKFEVDKRDRRCTCSILAARLYCHSGGTGTKLVSNRTSVNRQQYCHCNDSCTTLKIVSVTKANSSAPQAFTVTLTPNPSPQSLAHLATNHATHRPTQETTRVTANEAWQGSSHDARNYPRVTQRHRRNTTEHEKPNISRI